MPDSSPAHIRPRLASDLPPLAKILMEVHERDGYPVEGVADPLAWLQSDRLIGAWVAEVNGEPVGQVSLLRPGPGDEAVHLWIQQSGASEESMAVLGRLFVSSKGRGQHLGSRLTQTAQRHAQAMGRRAVLDVMAKDQAAIHTYEALGWTKIGSMDHQFGNGMAEPAFAYVSPAE